MQYGLYLAKIATLVLALLVLVAGIVAIAARAKPTSKGKLSIKKLNQKFDDMAKTVKESILSKAEKKADKKAQKEKQAQQKNQTKPRLFVVRFHGDIRASAEAALREEITAIILSAKPQDEVLVCLESPGGLVNAYGLAASQLQRLKDAKIRLTVAVDKVAASGGYMMACIADHIMAAPFAIIGSIGVVAQLPNFHRFLEKRNIDFEQITAGEYKRTLSLFGENTRQGRAKMQQEVDDLHELFKSHILAHRPALDIEKVATGEHWLATRAIDYQLIDSIQTSDDFLLKARERFDLYQIQYKIKLPFSKRIAIGANSVLAKFSHYL